MHNMKLIAIIFLFVFVDSVHANSASQAAVSYFDALKRKDFNSAATYFDPNALHDFRETMGFVSEVPDKGPNSFINVFFGPNATKESVLKLTDSEFFSAFLKAVMTQAEARGGINFNGMEVLGEVMEGSALSHVVTRNKVSVGEVEVEAMEVVSFRLVGKEWKALMSAKMKGIANQIRAAINQRK